MELFSSESLDTWMSAQYNCSLHLSVLSSLTFLSLSLQLFAVSQFSFLIGHIPCRFEQNFDLRLMLFQMRRLILFRIWEINSFTPESNCFIVICVSGSSILKMLQHASSTNAPITSYTWKLVGKLDEPQIWHAQSVPRALYQCLSYIIHSKDWMKSLLILHNLLVYGYGKDILKIKSPLFRWLFDARSKNCSDPFAKEACLPTSL